MMAKVTPTEGNRLLHRPVQRLGTPSRSIIPLLFVLSLLAAVCGATQPVGKTYVFYRERRTWLEAQQACRGKTGAGGIEGQLAVASTFADVAELAGLAADEDYAWVGLRHVVAAAQWQDPHGGYPHGLLTFFEPATVTGDLLIASGTAAESAFLVTNAEGGHPRRFKPAAPCEFWAYICEFPKAPVQSGWPTWAYFEVLNYKTDVDTGFAVCEGRRYKGRAGHLLTTYTAAEATLVAGETPDDALLGLELSGSDWVDRWANGTQRTSGGGCWQGPLFVGHQYCGSHNNPDSGDPVASFDQSNSGNWKKKPAGSRFRVICRYDHADGDTYHAGWKRFELVNRDHWQWAEAAAVCAAESRTYTGDERPGRLITLESVAQHDAVSRLTVTYSFESWLSATQTSAGPPKVYSWADGADLLASSPFWLPGEPETSDQTRAGIPMVSGRMHDLLPTQRCMVACEFDCPVTDGNLPFSYEFHSRAKGFTAANAHCRSRSVDGFAGEMLLPRSSYEHSWAAGQMARFGITDMWVQAASAGPGLETGGGQAVFGPGTACAIEYCPNYVAATASEAAVLTASSKAWSAVGIAAEKPFACRFYRATVSPSRTLQQRAGGTPAPASADVVETRTHRYERVLAGATRTHPLAAAECAGRLWRGQSGRLPNTYSAEQTRIVAGLMLDNGDTSGHVWVGGTDIKELGRWVWPEPTGRDVHFATVHGPGSPAPSTSYLYTAWEEGQPNVYGTQRYIALGLSATHRAWEDKEASFAARVVCEWLKPPEVVGTFRLVLHPEYVPWDVAVDVCTNTTRDGEVGRLATTAGSGAEAAELAGVLRREAPLLGAVWAGDRGEAADTPALVVATAEVLRGAAARAECMRPFVCLYNINRTATVSATITPAPTRTASMSASGSASRSVTVSCSVTVSPAPTRSASFTATVSVSGSASPSAATASRSGSRTLSVSGSASRSAATASATLTATASARTGSRSASRRTVTASATGPTPSASATVSTSVSSTVTPAATATASASATRSRSASRPTASATGATATPSGATGSASVSLSMSSTRSGSAASASRSASASSSGTATPSTSVSPAPADVLAFPGAVDATELEGPDAAAQLRNASAPPTGPLVALLIADPAADPAAGGGDVEQGSDVAGAVADGAVRAFAGAFFAAGATAARCLDVSFGAHASPAFPADASAQPAAAAGDNATAAGAAAEPDGADALHHALAAGRFAAARLDGVVVGGVVARGFAGAEAAAQGLVAEEGAVGSASASANATSGAAVATAAAALRRAVLLVRLPRVLAPGTGLRMGNDSVVELRLRAGCAGSAGVAVHAAPFRVRVRATPRQSTGRPPLEDATDAAAVSAALVSPTAAIALQRINLIGDYCGTFEPHEPLSWLESPTRASVGGDPVRYQLGAAVFDPVIVGGAVVAMVAIGFVHLQVAQWLQVRREVAREVRARAGRATAADLEAVEYEMVLADSMVQTRAVHLMVFAFVLMVQPTVGGAVVAATYGAVLGERAAAVGALVVVAVACLGLVAVFLKLHFFADFVADKELPGSLGGCVERHGWAKGPLHWLFSPSGEWEHNDAAAEALRAAGARGVGRLIVEHVPDFPSLFDPLFMDYREGRQWFLGLELAASMLLAVGAAIAKAAGCLAASWVLFVVSVGYFAGVARLRPYAVRAENGFAVLMGALQGFAAVGQLLDAYGHSGGGEFEESMVYVMSGLAFGRTLYELVKLARRVASRKQRLQQRPPRHGAERANAAQGTRGGAVNFDAQLSQALLAEVPALAEREATPLREATPEADVVSDVATEGPQAAAAHIDLTFLDEMTDGIGGGHGDCETDPVAEAMAAQAREAAAAESALEEAEARRTALADEEWAAECARRQAALQGGLLAGRVNAEGGELHGGGAGADSSAVPVAAPAAGALPFPGGASDGDDALDGLLGSPGMAPAVPQRTQSFGGSSVARGSFAVRRRFDDELGALLDADGAGAFDDDLI